jgi:Ribbon-helix-helix protein, copG family
MTTISLKLPEPLLARLEEASRRQGTTKSSLVRQCLVQQLAVSAPLIKSLPKLRLDQSFHSQALPILKKAWTRRGRGLRDLATNKKHLADFGQ